MEKEVREWHQTACAARQLLVLEKLLVLMPPTLQQMMPCYLILRYQYQQRL
jgi:hypothetical protein